MARRPGEEKLRAAPQELVDPVAQARQWLDSVTDEALGSRMRSIMTAQPDDVLGRYFRHVLSEMSDEEFLATYERNLRAQYAALRPGAKA